MRRDQDNRQPSIRAQLANGRLWSKRAGIATLLLLLFASAVPAPQRVGPDPVAGELGRVFPQSGDVRMADTPAHQDTRGGNNQVLHVLAGSAGTGYGAVWRDQRDGMLGLYLARLDPRGTRIEPERPFHVPHTGRRREPALALQPDHSGAIVWITDVIGQPIPWLRAFDAKGRIHEIDVALLPLPATGGSSRARETGVRQPAIAPRHPTGWFVAWTESGKVRLLETDAQGEAHGTPIELNPQGQAAEPGIALASSGRTTVCLWRTGAGSFVLDCARPRGQPTSAGSGVLARLVGDPNGGYWALFQDGGRLSLQHLSSEGRPDREGLHPIDDSVAFADLAAGSKDLVILAELGTPADPGARGARGVPGERAEVAPDALRLFPIDRTGRPKEGAPLAFLPAETRAASQARIAANDTSFLVAWTEIRERNDPDVFARPFDPAVSRETRLGPVQQLNSDVASADQTGPAVASAGEHAVIAWQDKRDGFPQVYARRIKPTGFDGGEIHLPAAIVNGPPSTPAETCEHAGVAVRANGDFLVSWRERREPRAALLAQLFAVGGQPIAPPITIEEAPQSAPLVYAWASLPDEAGYLLLYARGEERALWALRITPEGAFAGEPRRVSTASDLGLANPALALLDNRRLFAAWDVRASREGAAWSLRGRFLDVEGVAQGDEIAFEPSPRGNDWDPALAPTSKNGFVIAWTAGSPDDGSRDVVARFHDSRGKPAGPLLAISHQLNEQDYPKVARLADGSVAIVWEDDVSTYDQALMRRIFANGRELGPILRIHELETRVVEDRAAPIVAALGDGLVAAWGDRRRSQGWDVYVRILGPRFDAASRR